PVRHSPKKFCADNLARLIAGAEAGWEKASGAFVLDRKDEVRHIKHRDAFDPKGRMLHRVVVPQVNLGLGGAKFPLWYSTRASGDTPTLDCQGARLHPFDAVAREVIDLGGFPGGVVEHPTLGVEIKINPTRFDIVIRRDESDMPPGCTSVCIC